MTSASLPTDSKARKEIPLATGLLDYFPAALAYVARVSKAGNDKHNPGQPMHHARGKSGDHADCIIRHLADRGTVDPEDNLRHMGKVAWRALAELQEELEREEGAPLPRGARAPQSEWPGGEVLKMPAPGEGTWFGAEEKYPLFVFQEGVGARRATPYEIDQHEREMAAKEAEPEAPVDECRAHNAEAELARAQEKQREHTGCKGRRCW